MLMRSQVVSIHNIVDPARPDTYVNAVERLLRLNGVKPGRREKLPRINSDEAHQILQALFMAFLEEEKYTEAALLAWGSTVFNPEPPEVQRMFKAFDHHNLVFL